MTGEIPLRGKVLPVGGVKEKILAARRAGIRTVVLPAKNQKDLVDIPAHILKQLKIVQVRQIEEVLSAALVGDAARDPDIAAGNVAQARHRHGTSKGRERVNPKAAASGPRSR